jgi:hypothetical protein
MQCHDVLWEPESGFNALFAERDSGDTEKMAGVMTRR